MDYLTTLHVAAHLTLPETSFTKFYSTESIILRASRLKPSYKNYLRLQVIDQRAYFPYILFIQITKVHEKRTISVPCTSGVHWATFGEYRMPLILPPRHIPQFSTIADSSPYLNTCFFWLQSHNVCHQHNETKKSVQIIDIPMRGLIFCETPHVQMN